ncbi:unannotated protein [freshwater metagenome]|jgi:hypothetical protein|uniref:Unannotated protein n=1 Tax=freshwater metagenome TaxID=449393 RepID=A0A6J6DXE3_9ZZZZ|nr:DUF4417 domain-containing protein [Actinomycetota bacterium]
MRARLSIATDGGVFSDVPEGYPVGRHQTEGPWEIPMLARVPRERIPEHLVAFNDLGRSPDRATTGVHFFRHDETFAKLLACPAKYGPKFSEFQCVLTPDITLGAGMNPWMKARRVAYSRMTGVIWQTRGLVVIPTLRWNSINDLELVCSGVPKRSVIAVSNYGSRRDADLRHAFESGLPQVIERVDPSGLIVFGDTRGRAFSDIPDTTLVRCFEPFKGTQVLPDPSPKDDGVATLF